MKKRILSIVLTLCMVLMFVPQTVFAANDDATALQNLLNGGGTVTLSKDYTIDTTLSVQNTVTLDLNGHVIKMTGSGSVISIAWSNLTLQDSSPTATHTDASLPAGGVITGGNAAYGGGVYVGSGGSMTMNGGTIKKCSAECGGGVAAVGGSFTMTGGTIANCTATTSNYTYGGGGVYFASSATFTMNGGTIENCSSKTLGGGVFSTSNFSMSGNAIIRGCSAKDGGGVCIDRNSMTMNGGTIEACTSTNGTSDAVMITSNNVSLLANGGIVKGTVTFGSCSAITTTSTDSYTKFYNEVTNYGTISGGVYYGGIEKKFSGTVSGTYHTVTFDTNGGSSVPTQWFVNTDMAPALRPANPTRDGYQAFDGWYNGDTKYTFGSTITESITLTAKFSNPITYDISYYLDGGTATNPATYNVESDAITLNNPVKTAYTFTGWSGTGLTDENNMTVTIAKGSTGDRAYTAHFSQNNYIVKFDTNGGSGISDKTGVKWTDTVLSGITAPTKDGWEFTGWKCGDMTVNANTKYSDLVANDTVTSVTLVAQWKDTEKPVITGLEKGKTYCDTVQFEVSDNVGIASVQVNYVELEPGTNGKYTIAAGFGMAIVDVTDKAGNKTSVVVTVNAGHTAGKDDGDCSTPVYCIYHPDTIVVEGKSHDFSGEWNKDKDGHWHICQNAGCTIADTKVSHSGTDDGDCTTAVVCECGYIITAANAQHSYGKWQSNGDGTHTRYCTVTGCNGYEDGKCTGGQATYFKKAVCKDCNTEYGNLLTDETAPTGEITVGTNKWSEFLNTITFGIFFKDTQSVTITASDDSYSHNGYTNDKAVKVEYYLYRGDTALTQADLAGKAFTAYNGKFSINPDNKYVVYARLTDFAGNVTYISSNGVVLDATAPVISGVENGKVYCEAQTVTVTEEYIESVKVNGAEVTLDANNQFTLNSAEGTQTIVVTDKAGNVSAEMIVTVNDGHTYEWQSENGQYWQKCKYCDDETAKKDIPTFTIDAPDTVCRTQDCEVSVTLPDSISDATLTNVFIGFGGAIDTTIENGMLSSTIESSSYPNNENSFKLIVYATTDDGFSFKVSKTVEIQNEHAGGVATCTELAICDTCGEPYGELDSTNHNLEKISAKPATVTETGNREYWHCLDCDKFYADANGEKEIELTDTVIAKLPPEIIEGKGQSITAGGKKELTFRSNAAFGDFIRAQLDGKTLDEKNYTVKEGSTVVTLKADYVATLSVGEHTIGIVSESGTATTTFTVNAKKIVNNDKKSPETGNDSETALWFALLLSCGGVIIVTGAYGKRKKRSR